MPLAVDEEDDAPPDDLEALLLEGVDVRRRDAAPGGEPVIGLKVLAVRFIPRDLQNQALARHRILEARAGLKHGSPPKVAAGPSSASRARAAARRRRRGPPQGRPEAISGRCGRRGGSGTCPRRIRGMPCGTGRRHRPERWGPAAPPSRLAAPPPFPRI